MSNIEIERKFLVSKDAISKDIVSSDYRIRQGYLVKNKKGSVRVRIVDHNRDGSIAYLMSKIKIDDMTNIESSDNISVENAESLLTNFCSKTIDKKRHIVIHGKHMWEIDLFQTPNEGLLLAEIELGSTDERFEMPPWIIKEVTGQAEYYNANM
jgi:adenylate cyclase